MKITRVLLFLVILVVLFSVSVEAQQVSSKILFPVSVGGKTGFIDKTGKMIIEPKFDGAHSFSEGLAVASFGRDTIYTAGFSQGYIDETGKVQITSKWDIAAPFLEGAAAVGFDQTKKEVKLGNKTFYTSSSHTYYKWGFIDKTGQYLIAPKFFATSGFSEGLAAVDTEELDSKYGYIDKKGNFVIEPSFEFAGAFSEGLARIFIKDKYGFIDKTGKIIVKPQFSYASDFSEGLACVRIGGDVINPVGMSTIRNNGTYGFIDKTGKLILRLKNVDNARPFHEGLARIEIGANTGYIDRSGKIVIQANLNGISDFSEGLAQISLENHNGGFIDKTGKIVIKTDFYKVGDFWNGLAEVCESYDSNAKCGYIDKTGKIIWEPSI